MLIDNWDVAALHELFFEAVMTERWMPAAKQTARTTFWPEMQAEWLSYADPETRIRLTPTTKQVDRYHLAIEFSGHMDEADRKLVWAVAHSAAQRSRGPRWARLARMLGIDPRTVQGRYTAALLRLSLALKETQRRTVSDP